MAYFAQLDENKKVVQVIVADQEFIDSGAVGDPANWKECYLDDTTRGKYPGKGYEYDEVDDAFYPKKPAKLTSWVKDKEKFEWNPPKDKPKKALKADEIYTWDEKKLDYVVEKIDLNYDPKADNECLKSGNCIIDPVTKKIIPNPDKK